MGDVAPAPADGGALNEPAGETVQLEEPAREANVPALQGLHWERALAPEADEAVPGGQEMQPLEVSPMEGLKVPLGHGWQAAAEIEAGRLL